MEKIEEIFQMTYQDTNCNTSYPLCPTLWEPYKQQEFDIMEGVEDLSYYIHIPFCKSLCSFCEYTKFPSNQIEMQNKYMDWLETEIQAFKQQHPHQKLYGLDIGGGTPTSITDENFGRLMHLVKILEKGTKKVKDYEKSIEISFETITDRKLEAIRKAGFHRISAGLQVMSKKLLDQNNRSFNSITSLVNICSKIKEHGIEKLNIDIMYGLKNQTGDMLKNTIEAIKKINPEHVTVYEMRYNMVSKTENTNRELVYKQYTFLYESLIALGYQARFGANTFSRVQDEGLSSYLKYRMKEYIPYKGFGISAQSLSYKGISYNNGKNEKDSAKLWQEERIYPKECYKLPKEELLSKYIAIALYNGSFSLEVMKKILGKDPCKIFKTELEYLQNHQYITIEKNICYVTKIGFKYYGAIVGVFYSKDHLEYLQKKKSMDEKQDYLQKMTLFGKEIICKGYLCSPEKDSKERVEKMRLNLYISINDICNAKCKFCNVHCTKSLQKELDLQKLEMVLQELEEKGRLNRIGITGGETFLNIELLNKVLEVIKRKVKYPFVTINTNASLLEKIEEIKYLDIIEGIHISRHHYEDKKNNEIFGIQTATMEQIGRIHQIYGRNLIRMNCILMKGYIDNKEEIKKYLEVAAKYHIGRVGFVGLMPINAYAKEQYINFKEVLLDEKFLSTSKLYDRNICECENYLYTSQEHKAIVETYFRQVKNLNCSYCRQLSYTCDNQLLAGFGQKSIC